VVVRLGGEVSLLLESRGDVSLVGYRLGGSLTSSEHCECGCYVMAVELCGVSSEAAGGYYRR
jgi:hypothetical protein